MIKNRIILTVVSVILVVLIYSLPKVVVDNDSELDSEIEQSGDSHTEQFDQEALEGVRSMLNQLESSSDNEKIAIFADSLATLYDQLGLLDSAASFRAQYAELVPGTESYMIAGEAYYKAFSFSSNQQSVEVFGQKAREFFEKVMESEPDNLDVKAKIAMTYVSGSTPMQGIMILRSIIEEDPENEVALFNLGILSIQSGQYDRAIERLEKLTSIDPQNIQAQYFLGVSYFETDKKADAKRVFESILAMEPDETVQASVESYLDQLN